MEDTIFIVSCNGYSAAGRTTWIAAQELVLEGKAEWFTTTYSKTCDPAEGPPQSFIIIDGCEEQCLYKYYLEKGLVGKYHLTLPDVGIETLYFKDITREDIELAKDAVIAECVEIDNMRPTLFSGCCCR